MIKLNPACDSCDCVGTVRTFIGGEFTTVGGVTRLGIAKLKGNGSLDAVWSADISDADGNASIKAMALDGSTLYVAGNFDTIGGVPRECLAALNTITGDVLPWSADISIAPGDDVDCMILVGSTLYLGGTFSTLGGVARNNAGAVSTAGVVSPWDPNLNGAVLCLAHSAGIVYLGGSFTTAAGGTGRNRLAAFSTAGVLQAWNPNADSEPRAMSALGSIVFIVGRFSTIGGTSRKAAAAVAADGTLQAWDPSLRGVGGINAGDARCLFIDGATVYIGGNFQASNLVTRNHGCAVTTSGTLLAWNPDLAPTASAGGTNGIYRLVVTDGQVYMIGVFSTVGGAPRNDAAVVSVFGELAKWDPNLAGGSPTGESIIAAE